MGHPEATPFGLLRLFLQWPGYFQDMYLERPDDWEKAVEVDNAIEFWHEQGITKLPVYVSKTLVRLRDLPTLNFLTGEADWSEHHCNSGACFI